MIMIPYSPAGNSASKRHDEVSMKIKFSNRRVVSLCVVPIIACWISVNGIVFAGAKANGDIAEDNQACIAQDGSSSDGQCTVSTSSNDGVNESTTDIASAAKLALTALNDLMEELCVDNIPSCDSWAALGECTNNPRYMFENCKYSCGICKSPYDPFAQYDVLTEEEKSQIIEEADARRKEKEKAAEAAKRTKIGRGFGADQQDEVMKMVEQSKKYGKSQTIDGNDMDQREKTTKTVKSMISYMKELIMQGAKEESSNTIDTTGDKEEDELKKKAQAMVLETEYTKELLKTCQNEHELCCFWASLGECDNNAIYMKSNCGPCCQSCQVDDFAKRCPPIGNDVAPLLNPGDVDRMFQKLSNLDSTTNNLNLWSGKPIVHSQPNAYGTGFWVLEFPHFVKSSEIDFLTRESKKGAVEESVNTKHSIFWCVGDCDTHPISRRIQDRVETFMKLSLPSPTVMTSNHIEYMFVTRYEVGQSSGGYRHDIRDAELTQQCGPRAITLRLILESPQSGGVSTFNDSIPVHPQKGSLLVYPNVQNNNPKARDQQARFLVSTVLEGALYESSLWIHLYNYRSPHAAGCVV